MGREIKYTGIVKGIVDTSSNYISTGNVLNEIHSIGVIVKINNIERKVPLIKLSRKITDMFLKNIKKKLKEKYDIKENKTFTFYIPENRNIDDKVETTTYKQNIKGNVDKTLVFSSRTLFNNRIRKALLGTSKLINDYELI